MKNPMRALIETFREECPDGLWVFLRERREDRAACRAERRRRRGFTTDERTLEDMARLAKVARARVDEGFIHIEAQAREFMEFIHGERLRYVEFAHGLTVAVLKGGQMREYDEAGRCISGWAK